MKLVSCLLVLVILYSCTSQEEKEYKAKLSNDRLLRNQIMLTKGKSPLDSHLVGRSHALKFYPIDINWKLKAELDVLENPEEMVLKRSKNKTDKMLKWAKVSFEIHGNPQSLFVFKPIIDPFDTDPKDYLLCPFYDETNGTETYDNGRYVPLENDGTGKVVLDFNLAYNPNCAYSSRWSCTMPPPQNALQVAVEAGEKKYREHSQ